MLNRIKIEKNSRVDAETLIDGYDVKQWEWWDKNQD